jgi:hypothetical protein
MHNHVLNDYFYCTGGSIYIYINLTGNEGNFLVRFDEMVVVPSGISRSAIKDSSTHTYTRTASTLRSSCTRNDTKIEKKGGGGINGSRRVNRSADVS